eukprot:scaffold3991_cov159-Ochromonas_danica.AAC.11
MTDRSLERSCGWTSLSILLITVFNITIFLGTIISHWPSSFSVVNNKWNWLWKDHLLFPSTSTPSTSSSLSSSTSPTTITALHEQTFSGWEKTHQQRQLEQREEEEEECNDPSWCSIPMPTVSYFHFPPPTDPDRWHRAQLSAMRGEQVLLREAIKAFPTYLDFLDGDISFRKMHLAMDFFVDERRDLSPLLPSAKTARRRKKGSSGDDDGRTGDSNQESELSHRKLQGTGPPPPPPRKKVSPKKPVPSSAAAAPLQSASAATIPSTSRKESKYPMITSPKQVNGHLLYPWEMEGRRAVPEPYDFRLAERAPVVSVGYTAFARDSQTYFSGNRMGGAFIDRQVFFKHWRKVKDLIDTPFLT